LVEALNVKNLLRKHLAGGRGPNPAPRTGAELLAYWQGEGLVGTRPDISDGPAHARHLREQAQRRGRP